MPSNQWFIQLKELIVKHFSLDNLADLCLHLQINFEELGRGGLSSTVRELLLYVHRQGRLPALLEALAALRPQVDWPTVDDLSPFFLAFDPFQRHDFYQHINLPSHYVPRPELLAILCQALLAKIESAALPSAAPMNALHGMGGIGKSVIARALCDDSEVQEAFPDGILWATVGQQPDLIPRLREWIECLGGSITQTAPTIDQLKVTLADLLQERACLLIADDVWRREHATVFQVGGPRCRLLITTRDAAIARELGAAIQPVPLMPPDEAVQLLQQWSQGNLATANETLLQTIVAKVHYLPLAVKLAGSQLRLREPKAWLEAFDVRRLQLRRAETVHDNLTLTFALSLDILDDTDRRLYAALCIFKEDEATPVSGISKLWQGLDGLGEEETIELLADLGDYALLEWQPVGEQRAIRLHDLLRDMMAAELGEAGHQDTHHALLTAYRQTKTGPDWASAPDDGYLYAHLAYHLNELADIDAQAAAELYGLFANDAWLNVRVLAEGYLYDSYLADLMLAWQRMHTQAAQQIEMTQPVIALTHCTHYALIHTTANSMAANYEPALVARAIQVGIWQPQRALSVVRRIPDGVAKVRMCTEILAGCQEQLNPKQIQLLQTEALRAAQGIDDDEPRAIVLTELAPQLSGETRENALTQALQATQKIEYEVSRARILGKLSQLSGELVTQALQAAQEIGDERSRVEALAALAPRLSGELLTQALQATQEIGDERSRVEALAALAPRLSEELLTQALQAAQEIGDEWSQAQALAALASQLSGEAREDALAQALQAAQEIRNTERWVQALVTLVPQLSGAARENALAQVLQTLWIVDEWSQVQALVALVPQLSGVAREDALAMALQAVQEIRDEQNRVEALTALASQLSGEAREDALAQALQKAQEIESEVGRAWALAELAPQLSGELVTQALQVAQELKYEWGQTEALEGLAPQLSGDLVTQALQAVQEIRDKASQARALVALAPQLSSAAREDALTQALQAAQEIRNAERRAQTLVALAPQLSGGVREDALVQALQAAQEIRNAERRAQTLVTLAPQLSGGAREDALTHALRAVQEVGYEMSRAEVLAELAPQLSGEAREDALARALQATQRGVSEISRAEVLVKLAPQLNGETREDALARALQAAQEIEEDWSRAIVLAELAPQLSGKTQENALTQVLQTALGIDDERIRAWVLAELAPQLSGELLTQALQAAQEIGDAKSRVWVLVQLAPQLNTPHLMQKLQSTLSHAIWDLRVAKREELLDFLAVPGLFTAGSLALPPVFFAAAAQSIIDVCQEWRWL